jgi:peptide/histidine transporter 3/4
VEASNLITNFTGTADSFAGRLWTIAAGGVLSQLGMLGLVVSALVPTLCPTPCGAAAAAS